MSTKEFSEVINLIKVLYNKSYEKEELETMYELFKECDSEILKKSIRRLIGTSKYIPSISQILNEYKEINKEEGLDKLMKAKELGNIKTQEEFDKAMRWLEKGIIPNWLDKKLIEDKISEKEALEYLDGWEF